MVWKSHDDSIVQRSAIDQARQEKTVHHPERRRNMTEDSATTKEKATS